MLVFISVVAIWGIHWMGVNHVFGETTNLLIWWFVKFLLNVIFSVLNNFFRQAHWICTLFTRAICDDLITVIEYFFDLIHMRLWRRKIGEELLNMRKLWYRYLEVKSQVTARALVLIVRMEWLIQAVIGLYVRSVLVLPLELLRLLCLILLICRMEMGQRIDWQIWVNVVLRSASFGLSCRLIIVIAWCWVDCDIDRIAASALIGCSTIGPLANTSQTRFLRTT